MKKLTSLVLVLAAAVTVPTTMASARPLFVRKVQNTTLQPIPEPQPAAPAAIEGASEAAGVGAQPVPATATVVMLYPNVRYKDECNIAPCAVPQIVMVKDPCPPSCDPCNPCATPPVQCVAVQICVPPCTPCPPKVTCKRGGEYVKYDFGKYRVEIRSKKGCVTVDYDA
jgi:hypothetical protein